MLIVFLATSRGERRIFRKVTENYGIDCGCFKNDLDN